MKYLAQALEQYARRSRTISLADIKLNEAVAILLQAEDLRAAHGITSADKADLEISIRALEFYSSEMSTASNPCLEYEELAGRLKRLL